MPVVGAQSIIGEAPLSSAHDHAGLADEYHVIGDYARAIEEHRKAAEGYLRSVEYTQDAALQATLRRMHMDQAKAAEDLQRRIAQKDRDSSAISRTAVPKPSYGYLSPSELSPSRTPLHSPRSSVRRLQESTMSDRTAGSESYMFLGAEFTEAGDRFNRFWADLEGKLDQLTQPIAFATFGLDKDDNDSTDLEEDAPPAPPPTARSTTYPPKPPAAGKSISMEPTVIDNFDDDSDSDSFYLIPSANSPLTRKSTYVSPGERKLREENDKLRAELDQIKTRMTKTETLLKVRATQEAQLRDSIMLAKREAQRNLMQSTTFRHTNLNPLSHTASIAPNIPPLPDTTNTSPFISPIPGTASPIANPNGGPAITTTISALQKRIKDLEDETKRLRADNTKLTTQNTRFREKWASLKESAKRKRSLREAAGGGGAHVVGISEGLKGTSIKEEDEEDLQNSGSGRHDRFEVGRHNVVMQECRRGEHNLVK
ncbi:hypothetical protein FRB99_006044 [Tulasnella sp. 403]|nr:hypothetical protein FRB99_006044 [Tulasnella sp. 403]